MMGQRWQWLTRAQCRGHVTSSWTRDTCQPWSAHSRLKQGQPEIFVNLVQFSWGLRQAFLLKLENWLSFIAPDAMWWRNEENIWEYNNCCFRVFMQILCEVGLVSISLWVYVSRLRDSSACCKDLNQCVVSKSKWGWQCQQHHNNWGQSRFYYSGHIGL